MPAAELARGNARHPLAHAVAELFRANRGHATQEMRVALGHSEVGEPLVEPSRQRPEHTWVAAEEVMVMEPEEVRKAKSQAEGTIPREEWIAWADREPSY